MITTSLVLLGQLPSDFDMIVLGDDSIIGTNLEVNDLLINEFRKLLYVNFNAVSNDDKSSLGLYKISVSFLG